MKRTVATLAIGVSALAGAPLAHSEPNNANEQAFVTHMARLGVPFRDDVINTGYGVCLIAYQNPPGQAAALIDQYLAPRIATPTTNTQRSVVAAASLQILCPS